MVLRQRLIMRSEILSVARCIISELADLGSPSVAEGSTPENMDGFEIPVARHRALYCASLGAVTRYLRFVLYISDEAIGRDRISISACMEPSIL